MSNVEHAHVPRFDAPNHEPVEGQKAAETTPLKPIGKPQPSVIGIDRPPSHPNAPMIGPYLQFTGTDNDRRVWRGSALTLHKLDAQQHGEPKLSFDHQLVSPAAEEPVEVLYENVFGWKALRHNLAFEMPEGSGDELIKWTFTWGEQKREAAFHIPRWEQRWRGSACSCNGFDETVPTGTIKLFGFDGVWKHLNSVHEMTPMHIQSLGGDQIYIDFIFKDVPWLEDWLKLPWEQKWTREFPADVSEQVASYYFLSYASNWERAEIRKALETIPAIMQWDDHDIFDGAGSYPPEVHDSPVMLGLVRTANKFRLLFQHHSTPKLANTKHGMFGNSGNNSVLQCGPSLAILNIDGRTERDSKHVIDDASWEMIWQRLDKVADTTQHLIAVFAVPFSFIRVPAAEALFQFLVNRAPWVRQLPGVKGLNSIFDMPEFYDDLLDEWSHDAHIEERNRALVKLQQFAEKHSCRVTMFSGDVHCAGASRFRSDKQLRQKQQLTPATDPRLMMQFISSAIVNQSPSPNACIGYHYIGNKWHPVDGTDEELVEFFERRPEGGKHVRHRKVMPNRNWMFFEMVGGSQSESAATPGAPSYVVKAEDEQKRHHLHRHHRHSHALLQWSRDHYAFDNKRGYPSTLGPTSSKEGKGADGKPLHEHKHGYFCHHRKSRSLNPELDDKPAKKPTKDATADVPAMRQGPAAPTGLLVRMWLESRVKEKTETRQFSAYQVCVPDLVVGEKGHKRQAAAASAEPVSKPVSKPEAVAKPMNGHAATEKPVSLANGASHELPPPVAVAA